MKVRGAASRMARLSGQCEVVRMDCFPSYHYVCRSGGLRRDQLAVTDEYVVIWFGEMLGDGFETIRW